MNDIPYLASQDGSGSSSSSLQWLYRDEDIPSFIRRTQSTNETRVDWDLSNCCDEYEIALIVLVPVFLLIIRLLWNTALLKPMKLIAVFVHEMSHAIACWLTCGSVKGIEVHLDEGGVTKYVGGWRWFIIPAGYLGGAFWGGFLVTMSGNRTAPFVVSILFCVAMLVSLRFSPNRTMVGLNVFFILLTVVFIVVDRVVIHPFLNFLTLFYGVFIGAFSVYDIYDDLITRTVEGSDAHACHKLIPCCFPRCVGVQFAILALFFQGLGLYFALVWMTST